MAMTTELERMVIRLVGDASQYQQTLNSAVAMTANAASRMGEAMRDVGMEVSKISVPLAFAGGAAAKLSTSFELSLSRIEGLVGESRAQVEAWGKDILAMGPKLGRAPGELAEALYFITSAGIHGAQAINVLTESAKASTAGLGTTTVVADAVTSAINAYSKSNLTAANVTDVMTAAVREGKIEADGFAKVIGRVLPLSSALGISLEEVAGAMAVMSKTGMSAFQASTALRTMFTGMLHPSQEGRDELAKVGLSYEKVKASFAGTAGIVGTLRMLDKAFNNDADALSNVIPQQRALVGAMNLLVQRGEDVDAVMKAVAHSTGDMETAFQVAARTTSVAFDQAMSQLKSTLIAIGDTIIQTLRPALESLAVWLARVQKWWTDLDPAVRQAVVGFGLFVAVIGPALVIIGQLIIGLAKLNTLLYLGVKAAAGWVANPFVLWAGGLTLAVAALEKLEAALRGAGTDAETALSPAVSAFNGIRAGVLYVRDATVAFFKGLGDVLSPVWALMKAFGQVMLTAFSGAWGVLKEVLKTLGGILSALKPIIDAVATLLGWLTGVGVVVAGLIVLFIHMAVGIDAVVAGALLLRNAFVAHPVWMTVAAVVALVTIIRGAVSRADDLKASLEEAGKLSDKLSTAYQTETKKIILRIEAEKPEDQPKFAAEEIKKAEEGVAAVQGRMQDLRKEIDRLSASPFETFLKIKTDVPIEKQAKVFKDLMDQFSESTSKVFGGADVPLLKQSLAESTKIMKDLEERVAGLKEKFGEGVNKAKQLAGAVQEIKLPLEFQRGVNDLVRETDLKKFVFGLEEADAALFKLVKALSPAEFALAGAKIEEARKSIQGFADLEVLKSVRELGHSLLVQADMFGKTSAEVDIYKLKIRGATEEQVTALRVLAKHNDELDRMKKLVDDAKRVTDHFKTPQEKMTDRVNDLNDMLKAGALSYDTYAKAVDDAEKEMVKAGNSAEHMKGQMAGIQAIASGSAEALARWDEQQRSLGMKYPKADRLGPEARGKLAPEFQKQLDRLPMPDVGPLGEKLSKAGVGPEAFREFSGSTRTFQDAVEEFKKSVQRAALDVKDQAAAASQRTAKFQDYTNALLQTQSTIAAARAKREQTAADLRQSSLGLLMTPQQLDKILEELGQQIPDVREGRDKLPFAFQPLPTVGGMPNPKDWAKLIQDEEKALRERAGAKYPELARLSPAVLEHELDRFGFKVRSLSDIIADAERQTAVGPPVPPDFVPPIYQTPDLPAPPDFDPVLGVYKDNTNAVRDLTGAILGFRTPFVGPPAPPVPDPNLQQPPNFNPITGVYQEPPTVPKPPEPPAWRKKQAEPLPQPPEPPVPWFQRNPPPPMVGPPEPPKVPWFQRNPEPPPAPPPAPVPTGAGASLGGGNLGRLAAMIAQEAKAALPGDVPTVAEPPRWFQRDPKPPPVSVSLSPRGFPLPPNYSRAVGGVVEPPPLEPVTTTMADAVAPKPPKMMGPEPAVGPPPGLPPSGVDERNLLTGPLKKLAGYLEDAVAVANDRLKEVPPVPPQPPPAAPPPAPAPDVRAQDPFRLFKNIWQNLGPKPPEVPDAPMKGASLGGGNLGRLAGALVEEIKAKLPETPTPTVRPGEEAGKLTELTIPRVPEPPTTGRLTEATIPRPPVSTKQPDLFVPKPPPQLELFERVKEVLGLFESVVPKVRPGEEAGGLTEATIPRPPAPPVNMKQPDLFVPKVTPPPPQPDLFVPRPSAAPAQPDLFVPKPTPELGLFEARKEFLDTFHSVTADFRALDPGKTPQYKTIEVPEMKLAPDAKLPDVKLAPDEKVPAEKAPDAATAEGKSAQIEASQLEVLKAIYKVVDHMAKKEGIEIRVGGGGF